MNDTGDCRTAPATPGLLITGKLQKLSDNMVRGSWLCPKYLVKKQLAKKYDTVFLDHNNMRLKSPKVREIIITHKNIQQVLKWIFTRLSKISKVFEKKKMVHP